MTLRIVILISGSGTNLQKIIDSIAQDEIDAAIAVVISNRADVYGLERARNAGIATQVLDHKEFDTRQAYDAALRQLIDDYDPGLVVLAGFMRILTTEFVEYYRDRLINIHPALLPHYKGLDTHHRVLDDGARQHGASAHFVTPDLDSGPVIIQRGFTVNPDDTVKTLEQRVHEIEYEIYPRAIRWFAQNRLSIENDRVLLDGELKSEQGIVDNN
ncbi:MAG: phosphoribosylglycinamide formyltransferase [Gammaproteobacteria bacterium]|nr:phosphoribosylglycinamide formyltransferase [Gammaproteobacteria bacterium]